jgi:hypothetical protein
MRGSNLSRDDAIRECQQCRRVVDPLMFDELGTLLDLLETTLPCSPLPAAEE